MAEDARERRKFVRLNALVDVVYAKKDSSADAKLSLTRNISEGGICLILYEKPEINEVLELKIYLPEDASPIVSLGKVVWSKEFSIGQPSLGNKYDAGIQFIEINSQDLQKINKYVFRYIT